MPQPPVPAHEGKGAGLELGGWRFKHKTQKLACHLGGQIWRKKAWIISLLCGHRNTTPESKSPATPVSLSNDMQFYKKSPGAQS